MNIYIDFDHTISPNGYTYKPQSMELPPIEGAVEAIQGIKAQGHTIIIFSCRANKDVVGDDIVELKTKEMTDYLKKHFIPYDSVYKEKPNYDIVIDDKAIGFNNNWKEIKKAIKG
jgi:predicted metallo-beta-lactamase superfamily hydrolase